MHLLSCRAVYVAIPVCVAGVILITQPAFLGQDSQERSKLGIMLAVGQVRLCQHTTYVHTSTHTYTLLHKGVYDTHAHAALRVHWHRRTLAYMSYAQMLCLPGLS